IGVLEAQLRESQLQTTQAGMDAQGRVKQAEAQLYAAQADLAQQEATLRLRLFDKEAYTKLAQTGAVSERQGTEAVSNADSQQAAVTAAQRRVEAMQGALNVARANLENPGIRSAEGAAVVRQIAQQRAEVASASADAQRARGQLSEA